MRRPRRTALSIASLHAALLAAPACARHAPSSTDTRPVATTRIVTSDASAMELQTVAEEHAEEATVAAPPERVWAALLAAYDTLRLPVTLLSTGEHVVAAQRARLVRRFDGQPLSRTVTCGTQAIGPDRADAYEVALSVRSSVRAGGDGSIVRTLVHASARPLGTAGDPVQCSSRGRVEQRIMELVRRHAG